MHRVDYQKTNWKQNQCYPGLKEQWSKSWQSQINQRKEYQLKQYHRRTANGKIHPKMSKFNLSSLTCQTNYVGQ